MTEQANTRSTSEADRSTYTQKVDFTKLRSELLALDTSDTSITLASHERLSNDLAKLNSRLRDEISRAQASVRLDLNLEKGRIREEAKGQELKIKETETRIEQEVAGLKERVEGVKFSTLQWLMFVFDCNPWKQCRMLIELPGVFAPVQQPSFWVLGAS